MFRQPGKKKKGRGTGTGETYQSLLLRSHAAVKKKKKTKKKIKPPCVTEDAGLRGDSKNTKHVRQSQVCLACKVARGSDGLVKQLQRAGSTRKVGKGRPGSPLPARSQKKGAKDPETARSKYEGDQVRTLKRN